jgi:hypothetical protein
MARMREFIQSVPEERLVEFFRNGIHDLHGRSDFYYQELIRRDSRGLLKNEILDLVRKRETPPNNLRRLMVPGGQGVAHVAAKFFGHEPDFREALLKLVVDTNEWEKSRNLSYGAALMNCSSTIDFVLYALAENENPGALATMHTIGQEGQLVPGSRVSLYISLGRRYNSFEAERQEILRILASYLREETDAGLLTHMNGYSDFKPVQDALRKSGLVPAHLPEENKAKGGNIPVSGLAQQKDSASNGAPNPGNGHPLLWPGLFMALGFAALAAALIFKFFKRTT